MGKTNIEWADKSWNPIRARNKETGAVGWFCTPACDACRFCYAEAFNMRLGTKIAYKAQNADKVEVFIDEKMICDPLRWKKPASIFPCSMTDLFGEFVTNEMIDTVWGVMALTPRHRYMVLTKRPERAAAHCANEYGSWPGRIFPHLAKVGVRYFGPGKMPNMGLDVLPLPNVWIGTSIGNRKMLPRLDALRRVPAAFRFLSLEPLLEDLGEIDLTGIHWVIVGGESGPRSRLFNVSWARSIIEQCRSADVACFLKQLGRRPYWDLLNGCGKWPRLTRISLDGKQVDAITLKDKKGGDMAEWAEDLRVREMPS